MHVSTIQDACQLLTVTGTVTDAHGVDANEVGATSVQPHGPDNRSQRLSQSITVSKGYPVTLTPHHPNGRSL